jgi:hypothetical protein
MCRFNSVTKNVYGMEGCGGVVMTSHRGGRLISKSAEGWLSVITLRITRNSFQGAVCYEGAIKHRLGIHRGQINVYSPLQS